MLGTTRATCASDGTSTEGCGARRLGAGTQVRWLAGSRQRRGPLGASPDPPWSRSHASGAGAGGDIPSRRPARRRARRPCRSSQRLRWFRGRLSGRARDRSAGLVTFVAFDVLWLNGQLLISEPPCHASPRQICTVCSRPASSRIASDWCSRVAQLQVPAGSAFTRLAEGEVSWVARARRAAGQRAVMPPAHWAKRGVAGAVWSLAFDDEPVDGAPAAAVLGHADHLHLQARRPDVEQRIVVAVVVARGDPRRSG